MRLVCFSQIADSCIQCLPGGSTIVILFEKGTVQWDEDLLINSRASLETLVRVGMHIGKARIPSSKSDG